MQSHKNYKENIGTKLITNNKKQKLKIQSTVWNFQNTILKKIKRKRRRKKVTKIIFKKYRYKIYNKYQKAKIKHLEQSLEFQIYYVKKKNDHKNSKNISRTFSGGVVGRVGSVLFWIVPWSGLYFSRSIGPFLCSWY